MGARRSIATNVLQPVQCQNVEIVHIDEAIYVLAYHEGIQVKRIQRFLTGAVAVRSDNERVYHEGTVRPEDADRTGVAGRARWIARLI